MLPPALSEPHYPMVWDPLDEALFCVAHATYHWVWLAGFVKQSPSVEATLSMARNIASTQHTLHAHQEPFSLVGSRELLSHIDDNWVEKLYRSYGVYSTRSRKIQPLRFPAPTPFDKPELARNFDNLFIPFFKNILDFSGRSSQYLRIDRMCETPTSVQKYFWDFMERFSIREIEDTKIGFRKPGILYLASPDLQVWVGDIEAFTFVAKIALSQGSFLDLESQWLSMLGRMLGPGSRPLPWVISRLTHQKLKPAEADILERVLTLLFDRTLYSSRMVEDVENFIRMLAPGFLSSELGICNSPVMTQIFGELLKRAIECHLGYPLPPRQDSTTITGPYSVACNALEVKNTIDTRFKANDKLIKLEFSR
ncbi:hypothetical protein TWF281_007847 [Arthrobotrys megalospora]